MLIRIGKRIVSVVRLERVVDEDDPEQFDGDEDMASATVRCRGCGMMSGIGTRCQRCNTPMGY